MRQKTDTITIKLPDGSKETVKKGCSLLELSAQYQNYYKSTIIAAKVDNDIKELKYKINSDCSVEFIDLYHSDGIRFYQRSITFVMIKAVHDVFPDRKVGIQHSLSKQGLYCEVKNGKPLSLRDVERIEARMKELVEAKLPFVKKTIPKEEARKYFKKAGRMDRYRAIEHRIKPHVTMYECDGLSDYFYGYMAPHTGYVKKFKLLFYPPALVLMHPQKDNPEIVPEFEEQKKLINIFTEYKRWGRILGVHDIGAINQMIKEDSLCELVRISEALHEKKIAQIADMITKSKPSKRVVLIAGPSSSGKTTFANRLSIQLRVNGKKPVTISLDDYYKSKNDVPVDEDGKPDFEALEALDVKLFNEHLYLLVKGKIVEIPVFDFTRGSRSEKGKRLGMEDDHILIIEGIHGLNGKLASSIPENKKFKVYVSALTSLNIDDHNRIPSTDTRLIRRITRDNKFRGTEALGTLRMWPSVRRGEKRNIFPYQEEADIMFNSSLKYELGVLKVHAEPLLREIDRCNPEYSEARRLIEFLSYFLPAKCDEIPPNSIIREFIGGSCFYK